MLGIIFIQINIINAYLESTFDQNKQLIYMKIPQGCWASQKKLVYKILKSLYRLKWVGRFWNKIIIKFFWKIGFTFTNADIYILTIK